MCKTISSQGDVDSLPSAARCDRCGLIGARVTVVASYRLFENSESSILLCQWCRDRDLACEREARDTRNEGDI